MFSFFVIFVCLFSLFVKSYAYYKKHVQDATTRKTKTVSEAKKVIKCCLFFFFVSARSELPLLRTQDILDFQPVAMLKAAQTQGYSLSFLLFLYYVHSFICLQLRHVVAFPSKRKSRADPGVELVFSFFIIFFFPIRSTSVKTCACAEIPWTQKNKKTGTNK